MGDDPEHFQRRFRNGLGEVLRAAGLSAVVFIWDDFHDRYLISNLVGISLPNGFDTTTAPGRHHAMDSPGTERSATTSGENSIGTAGGINWWTVSGCGDVAGGGARRHGRCVLRGRG